MSKQKQAIGAILLVAKTKNKRRSKPFHLRGSKKLGPRSPDRGNRGKR